jgi:hypothetical protein
VDVPKPQGERRPRDVIANAVHVMRITTGEIEADQGRALVVTAAERWDLPGTQ